MYMFDIVENKLHRYLMAGSWETFCLSCCYIIECMTIWQTVDCYKSTLHYTVLLIAVKPLQSAVKSDKKIVANGIIARFLTFLCRKKNVKFKCLIK